MMQREPRLTILGLLIVLIAIVLVGVGVVGLLSRKGRTVITMSGVRPTNETSPTAHANDVISVANVPSTSALRIEVLSALYDVSGKPTAGCAEFDNKVPARRLTLRLAVVNDSGMNFRPGEWGAAVYAGMARATLCFSGAGGLPAFVSGTRQPVTFVAFTDPDQSVTSVTISALNGLSARACFEEERVVACPAT